MGQRIIQHGKSLPPNTILGRVGGRGDAQPLTPNDLRRMGLASAVAVAAAATAAIKAGTGITVTDNGDGTVTVAATGGGGSVGPRQGSVTQPLKAAFTAVNFAASTVGADGTAGIMLTDPTASTTNFRGYEQAVPATPYSLYAHFGFAPAGSQAGLTLRDTTNGRLIMMGKFQNQFIVTVWNSLTSFAGNRVLTSQWQDTSWFRFDNDGTTIKCWTSYNGLDWFPMFSETIASFLVGPMDKQGFMIQTDTANVGLLCDSFSNTAPT